MKSPARTILAAAALAGPALALAQEPVGGRPGRPDVERPPLRQRLEALEAHLERAVARVSLPHAGVLMGRIDATRGYRLPGYGILFVISPRALPGERSLRVEVGAALPRGGRAIGPPVPPVGGDWEEQHVEELERQVLVLQHVAEAERRAAEEDMERIVRDVRIRLAPLPPPEEGSSDAGAAPGGGEWPAPAAPGELALPSAPPWKFWFEDAQPVDERSPDRVVAEVRTALIDALESQASRVVELGADEFVAVAVDFVPGGLFASHPRTARTLVVRARQRDLAARARGAIGTDELRRTVEVIEY